MRVAHNEVALKSAIGMAMAEAEAAFGDNGVYLEKFLENSRHVEVQILADEHGNVVALGERECTIQRRHQKLIEETPSTGVTPELREKMMATAVRAAKAIGYTNAGTAEFLLADNGEFYFIEFNARIQVEHPVTEEVTGLDLVKEQIRIATGEKLGILEAPLRGASIEARVYAEDPENNFAPSPGKITQCHIPGGPGIRVDSHLFAGYTIPRYYDSLVAKIISWGQDRDEAINRLAGALEEFTAEGIKTTAHLCAQIIQSEQFRKGNISGDMFAQFL